MIRYLGAFRAQSDYSASTLRKPHRKRGASPGTGTVTDSQRDTSARGTLHKGKGESVTSAASGGGSKGNKGKSGQTASSASSIPPTRRSSVSTHHDQKLL